jgi:hypothetical protein
VNFPFYIPWEKKLNFNSTLTLPPYLSYGFTGRNWWTNPVDNTQHHRLGELKRRGLLPRQVEDVLYLLKKKGNAAAHDNVGSLVDATLLLQSAFYLGKCLVDAYRLGGSEALVKFVLPTQRDT